MSQAIDGWGTIFSFSADAVVFVPLSEVDKVSIPGAKAKIINVSHLQSPLAWEEFIAGMIDAGECTIDCNYVAGQAGVILAQFRNTLIYNITLPDGHVLAFSGFLSSWGLEVPKDDRISQPFMFKITGPVTFS